MSITNLNVVRRAIGLALFTWLPLWVGAVLFDDGAFGSRGEPLSTQSAIHIRCLLALPLFVLTEETFEIAFARCLRHLRESELAAPADLDKVLARTARLRDSAVPWLLAFGLALTWALDSPLRDQLNDHGDALPTMVARSPGLGSLWYSYVVVPIFSTFLLGWLWRVVLWAYALLHISRLPLHLVPSHPDEMLGLGFLARAPVGFVPLLFGISSVLSATWAHMVVHHHAPLAGYRAPALTFVTVTALVVVAPALAFVLPLYRAKMAALPDYAALVGEYGSKVRERWIEHREPLNPALLSAEELGCIADTLVMFQQVSSSRIIPLGKNTALMVGLPLGIPLLGLALCQIPLFDLLHELAGVLV